MRIAILSRRPKLYSTRRFRKAAEERGHHAQVIDALACCIDLGSEKPRIVYRDEELPHFDAVIPRIGASITQYGLAVLRQFEMMDIVPLVSSESIARSRDKLRSMQLLAGAGVPMPRTSYSLSASSTRRLIQVIGGAPVVVKLLEGTQGKGIVLGRDMKSATSVIEAFRALHGRFLVQEFIEEAGGADIRCIVVGNEVVAAMKRQGAKGEFRSNVHRGATVEPVDPTDEERATAVAAARTLGMGVAGVDLLRSARGPMVMEVNSSPGLEGIERATNIDIAARIIAYLEDIVGLEAEGEVLQVKVSGT